MIPHEAFDLSILDDGDGVGSHFGYGISIEALVSGAQANMTQYCVAFSASENETRTACSFYCSRC